ncbi:MAG: thiamine pyrophosphate-dependent dehydrogenase E1 component subunit alpha [Vicinamibacteria bacterium]|jgi:pyruvate dehydrogenase E1 component alpha subunit/2-oxoisovalerate dehydrogenase E1 component alpha subunit|nr:thiamine pyrophosphate-dependent dehydrogenase E1 component subunit alpha [Vicinamibacteria bacterium]
MTSAVCSASNVSLSHAQRLELYRFLYINRAVEERLSALFRQGKIVGGLFRSLGQEAASVGSAYALERGDLFAPMIRNLGAVLVRGASLKTIFDQYLGKAGAPTEGRECGVHFGWINESGGMFSITSLLGEMVPILVGAVMAERMRGRDTVALTYVGDGAMSTGVCHEAINLAAVQKAALVLIVENNCYAHSLPTERQTANPRFVLRAAAYGCFGEEVDGTDVVAVHAATRRAVERARRGLGPSLIESHALRRCGHSELDDMRYVPQTLLDEWRAKDPLARYEQSLLGDALTTQEQLRDMRLTADREIDEAWQASEGEPFPAADAGLRDVYGDRAVAPKVPIEERTCRD